MGWKNVPLEEELEKRAFWAAYLIEKYIPSFMLISELRVMYVNPGSRLDDYEHCFTGPRIDFTPPHRFESDQGFFFAAAVMMRRLLNRAKETRKRTVLIDRLISR